VIGDRLIARGVITLVIGGMHGVTYGCLAISAQRQSEAGFAAGRVRRCCEPGTDAAARIIGRSYHQLRSCRAFDSWLILHRTGANRRPGRTPGRRLTELGSAGERTGLLDFDRS
jgi:hypothetical protein